MNSDQQRFFKRAIYNYGVDINVNTVWFMDDGMIYYGKRVGYDIVNFIRGTIQNNVFVIDFISDCGKLDTCGWNIFLAEVLELEYINQ